jgi:hypothetical protein
VRRICRWIEDQAEWNTWPYKIWTVVVTVAAIYFWLADPDCYSVPWWAC